VYADGGADWGLEMSRRGLREAEVGGAGNLDTRTALKRGVRESDARNGLELGFLRVWSFGVTGVDADDAALNVGVRSPDLRSGLVWSFDFTGMGGSEDCVWPGLTNCVGLGCAESCCFLEPSEIGIDAGSEMSLCSKAVGERMGPGLLSCLSAGCTSDRGIDSEDEVCRFWA
jgi:hypothetical protein